MANLEKYLGLLQELKKGYAVEALMQPTGRDAFEYGRHCGVLEGLERAERLFHETFGEKDDSSHKSRFR